MKLKKKKKAKGMRGSNTHGWGARKKHMGSGHRGGFGMAGTGKRADQKKTFVIKKYKGKYFGKKGFTGKSTKKKINKVMNLEYIERNLENLKKKYGTKENILDLSEYKILGNGELKSKVIIKAKAVSESAKKKIEKAGGKVILPEAKEKPKKVEEKVEKEKPEKK